MSLPNLKKNISQSTKYKIAPKTDKKKKLTLRDYLYLNMLSNKCRNPETSSSNNSKTNISRISPNSVTSLSSRKKVQASNT